jgi:GrpB-like predicted nucleotidyltransferase (UPF0157 family)
MPHDGDPVVIAEYDPSWPTAYAREAALIRDALGGLLLDIEHVGSTAVPGLGAKPIIDIMAGVRSYEDGEGCVAPLEGLGYEHKGEFGIPGRRYFRKPLEGKRTHQVHMVALGGQFWRRHLLFRDYLRAHPETARAYYELKARLAEEHRLDLVAYTDAKTEFITGVEAKAAAWQAAVGER